MASEPPFDWDRANITHIARHGVTPEEAEKALSNEPFDLDYEVVNGEERWISLGHTDALRVLLVVWTIRLEETVRVVTAREATKSERTAYLKGKGIKL